MSGLWTSWRNGSFISTIWPSTFFPLLLFNSDFASSPHASRSHSSQPTLCSSHSLTLYSSTAIRFSRVFGTFPLSLPCFEAPHHLHSRSGELPLLEEELLAYLGLLLHLAVLKKRTSPERIFLIIPREIPMSRIPDHGPEDWRSLVLSKYQELQLPMMPGGEVEVQLVSSLSSLFDHY